MQVILHFTKMWPKINLVTRGYSRVNGLPSGRR